MTQIRNAVLRQNLILRYLRERGQMSAPQLMDIPEVRAVSPSATSVIDTLSVLHRSVPKLVRKLPRVVVNGSSQFMWEAVDNSHGNNENGTDEVPSITVQHPEPLKHAKPEITVEENRIVIEHAKCRIIVEF